MRHRSPRNSGFQKMFLSLHGWAVGTGKYLKATIIADRKRILDYWQNITDMEKKLLTFYCSYFQSQEYDIPVGRTHDANLRKF